MAFPLSFNSTNSKNGLPIVHLKAAASALQLCFVFNSSHFSLWMRCKRAISFETKHYMPAFNIKTRERERGKGREEGGMSLNWVNSMVLTWFFFFAAEWMISNFFFSKMCGNMRRNNRNLKKSYLHVNTGNIFLVVKILPSSLSTQHPPPLISQHTFFLII